MTKTLKIGTRTSGLAMAQTTEIARRLKEVDPELTIEIIGVKNVTGDLNKKTPLHELGTIGVFTKEIDEMVLSGAVDIAVHSLKDIGTKRPGTLQTIAVPERAQPHDCILFNDKIIEKIKNNDPIIIGASSPRRMALVPPFLENALPQLGTQKPQITVVPLRGNVPSRIQKLKGLKECDVQLDGICLAFSGISRLYKDTQSHDLMAELLDGLKWMILPLSECPGAPGQGALAVEALGERQDLVELLLKINDRQAQRDITLERNILIQHGGGCHQAFGVTAQKFGFGSERLLIVKGFDKEGTDISETRWLTHHDRLDIKNLWNGKDWRNSIFDTELLEHPEINAEAVFVSHARALHESIGKLTETKHIWTAGVQSWFKLAQKGLWVEGCADGLGYDLLIRTLLTDPVLQLPSCPAWNILTHSDASESWDELKGKVIPTYRLEKTVEDEAITSLKNADHIFWSSFSQYKALSEYAQPNAIHICGPGKTADLLKAEGVKNLIIAPNIEEIKKRIAG